MIRPRIGNFVYSELDVRSMYEDILAMKEEGVAGFAAGCLLPNGDIDTPTLQTSVLQFLFQLELIPVYALLRVIFQSLFIGHLMSLVSTHLRVSISCIYMSSCD